MVDAVQVSAVIITFNEESDIARALQSVAWCDEIVVVDSGSTDRTVEICKAHGCKVIHRDFTGYGDQKAFAVTRAANDWILSVDADEEVSPALRDAILSTLSASPGCNGYFLPITTVLWDRVVRTSRRHTKPKLRLFDRRFGNFGAELVHESVRLEEPTGRLDQPMYNYSFADFSDYFDKFNRYTSLAAQECFRRGNRAGFLASIALLPLTFLQNYVLKGFLLDGAAGLTWSLFASLYATVKHLKMWELARPTQEGEAREASITADGRVETSACAAAHLPDDPTERAGRFRRQFWEHRADYAFATFSVVLAWVLMGQRGRNQPAYYSTLTLLSVILAARFWGFGPALMATAIELAGYDYFVIPPMGLSLPDGEAVSQLVILAALSLAGIFLIRASQRKPLP